MGTLHAGGPSSRRGSHAGPSGARRRGSSSTGSPLMRTVNVSGSTAMSGLASLFTRSALRRGRNVGHRDKVAVEAEPVGQAGLERGRGDERQRRSRGHLPVGAPPHRPGQDRLRGGDRRGWRSPIAAQAMNPPLSTTCGRTPKNAGCREHQVRQLARLDRADMRVEPVRDRRADRVLGDVAPRPRVVAPARRRRPRPPSRTRPARRGAASSRARSARCGSRPRRSGPSPASPSRIMEIAPMSCRSSAAMVEGRIRDSANARSSGTAGLR